MKQILSLCLVFSSFSPIVIGQSLSRHGWNDYEGKLGDLTIRMSLYLSEDGRIEGNYCYLKSGKRIALSGLLVNERVELTEWLDGKMNGRFRGLLSINGADQFEGRWSNADSSTTYVFKLLLDGISFGEPAHRYKDFKSSDNMVEEYALKIKSAVISGNKIWLSNQFNYPLKTSFGDRKNHIINSKAEFMANFSRIFHPAFVNRIKNACTCNLFYDQDGAMIGVGDIWIDEYVHPPKGKKGLFILGINN